MELERDQFEEVALAHFVAQRAAGVQISGDNGCEPTRESLFWRDDKGDYGVRMFNAAWWGWKVAVGRAVPNTDALGEVIGCFDAAIAEGLYEAMAETIDARLKDLLERRIMHAYYAAVGPVQNDVGNPITATAPADIAQPATENVAQWLGPYKDGAEALDELRKACAEMLGYDVENWPRHGNACLAIASAIALRDNKAKTADQLKTALNELVNRTAPICESKCGPGMDAAFWDARRVLGLL